MPPSKAFIRARYDWIRLSVPAQNFYLKCAQAPTYGVELNLDHLRSHVHSLSGSILEGKEQDFFKLASDALEELNDVSLELEGCDVSEEEKEELRKYIAATQSLLEEIKISVH